MTAGPRATAPASWRDFRRLWGAHSISVFGDQLSLIALPIAAFLETESALFVGAVASLEGITALVFGLLAGALADRLPHRRVMVITDLGRGVALGALAIAFLRPGSVVVPLLVAAFALGMLRVLHDAAAAAAVPILVDRADVLAANGQLQASEAAGTAVGPAVAGGLIAAGGLPLAFAADAVSFVASGATVSRIRRLDEHHTEQRAIRSSAAASRIRTEVAEGLRAVLHDTAMLWVLAMAAAMNVVAVAMEAQFIPYARTVLGIGGLGIGIYFAIGGTAAVVTSLIAGRRVAARGDVVLLGVTLFSAGVLLAGLFPSLATVAVAFVTTGVGSALTILHFQTFRHRRYPVRLQGRVNTATRTVLFGVVPIALIGGGALSDAAGPEVFFVASAGVGLAVCAIGLAGGVHRIRET